MIKINSIQEVLNYLYKREIVFSVVNQKVTYFALREQNILAKSMNATYYVDEETLIQLFEKEDFYLHEKQIEDSYEEALLKDKEYYSWTHK